MIGDRQRQVHPSMEQTGNSYGNAIAERVNGICKGEYGLGRRFATIQQARLALLSRPSGFTIKSGLTFSWAIARPVTPINPFCVVGPQPNPPFFGHGGSSFWLSHGLALYPKSVTTLHFVPISSVNLFQDLTVIPSSSGLFLLQSPAAGYTSPTARIG